ncbi:hypothetical protein HB364_20525 [Pseudoflavitalea sp. X16]|uniref:hypothetical protein n=1 Tax=Paraflavitalea devenefica TaxID=2716334 RepID=UPI0014231243|nr:hypothetical protein [Paraflavitalea devenefica]NII27486.1 hypothetical protein [Paraflavitalea devenefica]
MSTKPNNPKEIDEVLNSLEGIQRAKAPAFFYTRLRGRMERELENTGGPLVRLLARPALALSLAAIILILNATAIMKMWHEEKTLPTESAQQQLLASDYPMGTYPVYDETPVVP